MTFAGVVLAAGRSSRMGASNKLLADLDGAPLITRTVGNLARSHATPIIIVTGHEAVAVKEATRLPTATFINNSDYASGMASSLRAGLQAVPADCDGAVILLGDMPLIESDIIDRLIAEAERDPAASAVVPTVMGEWAHPVLMRRALFESAMALTGDVGARRILAARADVIRMPIDDPRLLMDADDPAALAAIRERFAAR